jgi:hypothetical protein
MTGIFAIPFHKVDVVFSGLSLTSKDNNFMIDFREVILEQLSKKSSSSCEDDGLFFCVHDFRLLAVGYWLLAIGFWLLAFAQLLFFAFFDISFVIHSKIFEFQPTANSQQPTANSQQPI